jgi:hypothetical protein
LFIRDELESPLHPATISELKWYFEHRDQATHEPLHPQTHGFLNVGAKMFGTPRVTEMYRRWLKHGNAVAQPDACSPRKSLCRLLVRNTSHAVRQQQCRRACLNTQSNQK